VLEVMQEMVELKERIAKLGTWAAIEELVREGWSKEKLERAGIRSVFFRDTKTSFNDNIERLIEMTR
jgi:hypothetical protein